MKRSIFYLALPIILENILQTLLGTVDAFFAGKLADAAIAGISVTNLIMNIFISFFTAVSIGSTAVIARRYGEKEFEKVASAIVHALCTGLVLGISTGGVCLVFGKEILTLTGAEGVVLDCAMPYFLIVAVPGVLLCLQLILSSCLRAMEDTKTPMYVTGSSNLINILLDVLFIKAGLGIFGLGLATTIARGAGMIILFLCLWKKKQYRLWQYPLKLCCREFGVLLKIGVPAGLEKLIMRVGQLVYNGLILSIGTASYVAHNIAGTIESYAYIPAMGFGLAICTITGVSLGEKNIDRAKEQVRVTYWMSACTMVVIGAMFYLFAPQLALLFTKTQAVQEMVTDVLRIIAWFQPFAALVQVLTGALQGAGDTKFPMYATFLGIWILRIGLGYVLAVSFDMGLSGVWLAYAADLVVRGLLLFIRFRCGKWQEIRI